MFLWTQNSVTIWLCILLVGKVFSAEMSDSGCHSDIEEELCTAVSLSLRQVADLDGYEYVDCRECLMLDVQRDKKLLASCNEWRVFDVRPEKESMVVCDRVLIGNDKPNTEYVGYCGSWLLCDDPPEQKVLGEYSLISSPKGVLCNAVTASIMGAHYTLFDEEGKTAFIEKVVADWGGHQEKSSDLLLTMQKKVKAYASKKGIKKHWFLANLQKNVAAIAAQRGDLKALVVLAECADYISRKSFQKKSLKCPRVKGFPGTVMEEFFDKKPGDFCVADLFVCSGVQTYFSHLSAWSSIRFLDNEGCIPMAEYLVLRAKGLWPLVIPNLEGNIHTLSVAQSHGLVAYLQEQFHNRALVEDAYSPYAKELYQYALVDIECPEEKKTLEYKVFIYYHLLRSVGLWRVVNTYNWADSASAAVWRDNGALCVDYFQANNHIGRHDTVFEILEHMQEKALLLYERVVRPKEATQTVKCVENPIKILADAAKREWWKDSVVQTNRGEVYLRNPKGLSALGGDFYQMQA